MPTISEIVLYLYLSLSISICHFVFFREVAVPVLMIIKIEIPINSEKC